MALQIRVAALQRLDPYTLQPSGEQLTKRWSDTRSYSRLLTRVGEDLVATSRRG
jgi:hypothetical protein